MQKTLGKALVVLSVCAIIPISAWAVDGVAVEKPREPRIRVAPQWAVDACFGKMEGDKVSVTPPGGKTFEAKCIMTGDNKLTAMRVR